MLPMAIHRSVHKAKGAGCGRLPGTVVASGSGGSSASLRKVRPDFIPPRMYVPALTIPNLRNCHKAVHALFVEFCNELNECG